MKFLQFKLFVVVLRVRSREDGQVYAVKIANERYKGHKDRDRKLEEVKSNINLKQLDIKKIFFFKFYYIVFYCYN